MKTIRLQFGMVSILLSLVLLLCCFGSAEADVDPLPVDVSPKVDKDARRSEIIVSITLKQGSAVPGTVVILQNMTTPNKSWTRTTDAEGHCRYRNLRHGKYRLTLKHEGNTKQIPTFELKPATRQRIGVVLVPTSSGSKQTLGQLMGPH